MFKSLCSSSRNQALISPKADATEFEPSLDAREDLFSPRDYLRPMIGGAGYALCCTMLFSLPLLLHPNAVALLTIFGMAAVLIIEMTVVMGISAIIHHHVFLHRLRTYGPHYYSSEIAVDAPPAETFELCLAATSDLPRAKITTLDEKNGRIMVTLKGNFWITVDRQVTMQVRQIDKNKSVVSVDPSIKLTSLRKKMLRKIWGDKWYPLIFRSDVNWNRKIKSTITDYIESVPDWDHSYHAPEVMDHGYIDDMVA